MADEIKRELWRIKDDLAREHGYDLDALADSLQKKEAEEERDVVDLRLTQEEPGEDLPGDE